MLNFNEKRPERVLMKGDSQEIQCPTCKTPMVVPSNHTSAVCGCGQSINWGLRKN
jgi:hypothetical protein